jgi:GTP pyrophosphokinase
MSSNAVEIDLEKERKEILNAFRGLLRASKNKRSKDDTALIRKAFDVAVEAHKDIRRKSGEPYIYHPIAVARICAEEIGLGTTSIVCALLHDTVEDTHITLDDIEDLFGERVRMIIDGLTKIPEVIDDNLSLQAENFRKMILTISDDLRVVLIKLADRLHNMRTLESMRYDKRLKIASETLFLYAPLAHRLGLYALKSEMEDLAFKYKEPQMYTEIEHKLEKTKDVRNRFIRQFVRPIKEALEHEGYMFEIKARTKSISSIYRKMLKKEIPFEEVYDIFAIRIILDTPKELEKPDAWRVYSIVTDFYKPNPDRLRDWISIPRANGYESLHTTVMSPTGKWVEVQIRSKRMDLIAEKGLAAHYRYKESKSSEESKFDRWLGEVRELLETAESNALDFIDDFKLNLFNHEIYVFTPKGSLRVLPKGSTTLDFAFDIHTQIGARCLGAKVNNKLVPLSHELNNGDQVEIITSEKQRPKEEWLKMVVTARAKQKIKTILKEERKIIGQDGKEILERKFNQLNIHFNSENIFFLEKFYNVSGATDLYYLIAKGKIDLNKLREIDLKGGMFQSLKKEKSNKDTLKNTNFKEIDLHKDTLVIGGDNASGIEYKMARCCNPIPGDPVFGYISNNDGIKIHLETCPNATQLMSKYAYRIIKVKWKSQLLNEQVARLKLVGLDDVGIVHKITEIISKQNNINMRSISFKAKDGIFEGLLEVLVYDTEHLKQLISKFEMVEGVKSVERFISDEE